MPLNFTEIQDGESFELFCAAVLRVLGFEILSPPGRGLDGGVDMIIRSPLDPNLGITSSFIVQCKHYAKSGRSVGVDDLTGISISDLIVKYAAQGYLLITSTVVSQSLQSHLNGLQHVTGRQLVVWDRDILEARLAKANDANLVQRYFPASGRQLRDSILLPPNLPSWETVTHTLRAHAISDIAQTIAQKYIPDLYVTRASVESRLNSFINSTSSKGNLVERIRSLKGEVHETTKNCHEILERTPISKVATADPLPKPAAKYLDINQLEQYRQSYRHVTSMGTSIQTRLMELERLTEQLANLVDPQQNLYVSSRTETTALLALIQSKISESTSHFSDLKSSLGKVINLLNNGKSNIKNASTKEPVIQHRIVSLIDAILGAAEEISAGINIAYQGLEELKQKYKDLVTAINPAIVIIEKAGRGKTNLVCDLVARVGAERPVFFIAAKSLPLAIEDPVKKHIHDRVQTLPGFRQQDPLAVLSQAAHTHNSSVLVIIDGINENVDPFAFAHKVHSFLSGIEHLPVRVIVTCREEYWTVFKGIIPLVAQVLQGDLGLFTVIERDKAIKKYFSHYRILTNIDSEPLKALRDPLLLRFFCEAYGNRSEMVGDRVKHIRLKALFTEYNKVKYSQIADQLKVVRSVEAVSEYVKRIARTLLESRTTSLNREKLENVLPVDDLNNVGSLYSRLLDEDIVLEQRYIAESGAIVVNFTYEAFMEYVIGGVVNDDREASAQPVTHFITQWLSKNSGFPNIAGVLGFYLSFQFERSKEEFFEVANWLQDSGREENLYSLQIGLDNIPPEEFDRRIFVVLLKRLSLAKDKSENQNRNKPWVKLAGPQGGNLPKNVSKAPAAFSPEEALRITLRCPSSLATEFASALKMVEVDSSKAPILWAAIFEHFGPDSADMMWESIRLRFSTSQPLRKLDSTKVLKILRWCRESSQETLTPFGQKVSRSLISQWANVRGKVKLGSHGGWNSRAVAVDELIDFLRQSMTNKSSVENPDKEPFR
jgi:hypothetical protein